MDLMLPFGQYYGQTLKSCVVAEFGLTETVYAPSSKLPKHAHEHPYYGFILRGTYRETYGKSSRLCQPAMLIFHPQGEVHSQHFDAKGVRLFRLEVSQFSLRDFPKHVFSGVDSFVSRGESLSWLAAKLYGEFQERDTLSALAMEGLILEILAGTGRKSTDKSAEKPPLWLRQARDLLHEHYHEQLSLYDIARAVGVHKVYLAREFRRHYRCSVGAYVRQLRIEAACHEMMMSDRAIASIAAAAGFYDQSHFTKAFRQVMGVTPGQYRATHRSG